MKKSFQRVIATLNLFQGKQSLTIFLLAAIFALSACDDSSSAGDDDNNVILSGDSREESSDSRSNDKDLFAEELRKDIMPMIESKYSTYAPTPDTEGFIASRDHRAMCGYSQGSSATTTVMKHLLDTARWWMPMSGPRDARDMKEGILAQGDYDFFVYIGCGGKRDLAYDSVIPFLKGAAADDFWSFGTDMHQNNLYATISNEVHQTLIGRYYLYNMLCDGLLK